MIAISRIGGTILAAIVAIVVMISSIVYGSYALTSLLFPNTDIPTIVKHQPDDTVTKITHFPSADTMIEVKPDGSIFVNCAAIMDHIADGGEISVKNGGSK